jgi:hypothetical protein
VAFVSYLEHRCAHLLQSGGLSLHLLDAFTGGRQVLRLVLHLALQACYIAIQLLLGCQTIALHWQAPQIPHKLCSLLQHKQFTL